jgi:hypothetical protein
VEQRRRALFSRWSSRSRFAHDDERLDLPAVVRPHLGLEVAFLEPTSEQRRYSSLCDALAVILRVRQAQGLSHGAAGPIAALAVLPPFARGNARLDGGKVMSIVADRVLRPAPRAHVADVVTAIEAAVPQVHAVDLIPVALGRAGSKVRLADVDSEVGQRRCEAGAVGFFLAHRVENPHRPRRGRVRR